MTPPTTPSSVQSTSLPVPPALEPFLDVARAFAPPEDEEFDALAFLRRAARPYAPTERLERHPLKDLIDGAGHSLYSTRLDGCGGWIKKDHDVLLGVCADGPATVVLRIGDQVVSTLRFPRRGGFRYAIDDEHFLPTLCVMYSEISVDVTAPETEAGTGEDGTPFPLPEDDQSRPAPAPSTGVHLVKALLDTEARRSLAQTAWACGGAVFPFPHDWRDHPRVRLQGLRTRGA